MKDDGINNWNSFVPWFLTIASSIVLVIIGITLVLNIQWFKDSVFDESIREINDPNYRFYAYHLHLSMIKRSIGLFSGFAIMFLGLGVSFFTMKDITKIKAESAGISAQIATASPGIVALIIGSILIIKSIDSKDVFPVYGSNYQNIEQVLDKSKKPPVPQVLDKSKKPTIP
ncbi:hypothetical protein [Saccharicrinis aurantiacus]|uniref:hypothetical protein n=1 Tax=Saccharicrinis aurantiacus TaxID=1849719 RepID=UPI0009501B60|nr:hypothetical protein [Saccharicrinis aurantiacus]